MAKQDYYATLEVARDASADDLKKAYRKLAMKYHPDRNAGDKASEARFKELNEAYDVLKDDQKRAAYDRFGHAAFEGGGPGPGGGGFEAGGGLGDIFDQVFGDMMGGRRGGGGGPRAGADVRAQVEISLTDAFSGIKVPLRVPSRIACEACNGSGSEDKARGAETCPTCHGAGKVRAQQGFFLVERGCPTCGGRGRVVRNPCKVCRGAGTVERDRNISVDIPAGIEDGTRLRVQGEGEAGPQGSPNGDLYLHVGVKPHEIFQRDGATVVVRVPVGMTMAALGGHVEVPVVDGTRTKLTVPAGSQTGDQHRLRGKGFSALRSSARGDMYVVFAVETPRHLTKRQRELLEEFQAEGGENDKSNPETEGFFSRVRDFFEGRS
ncbi:molecular chaperone DnaJ [Lichenicola cladoniae]|uniref:Chaperone protein DnaJ n=1 Tax=Lichenicola cladoniae TaxID=1484109 RepID=A0A6M8H4R3_9PROT|nr:molecular chaperone DnaJ [Lichenicola cladoniae]NPD66709.1 molecular chaperone DnaJ [Acetobacteraceae bacterium]QKE88661.1 molecular chaperone DnaJ [Lichenicola cladoniae]